MLRYVMLCYVMLCCVMLCYVMLRYEVATGLFLEMSQVCREADAFAERFFEEDSANEHLDALSKAQKEMMENEVAMVKLLSMESLILAAIQAAPSALPEKKEKVLKSLRSYKAFFDTADNCFQLSAKDLHPTVLEALDESLK